MRAQLQNEMKVLMKSGDRAAVETIRSLMSAIQYEEMQRGVEPLPQNAAIEVLQREIKKRREEIEFADQGGRPELKERSLKEIALIERFLPQQLSTEEIERILTDMKGATPDLSMGAAMKSLKELHGGRYDAKTASELAKRICG